MPVFKVRQATHDCVPDSVQGLLEDIEASGMTYSDIQRLAGLGDRTIEGWRKGRKPTPFLVECVREVLNKNTLGC